MAERNFIRVDALKAEVDRLGLTLQELIDRMSVVGDAPGIAAVWNLVKQRAAENKEKGE